MQSCPTVPDRAAERTLNGMTRARRLLRDRRVLIPLQVLAVAVLLASLAYAVRDVWPDAAPRIRDADPVDLMVALLILAAYYLLFIVGWIWILRAFGIRLPYRFALQAEMLSMLAKYIPGGVWTPMARVFALRRFGYTDTPIVLASIALEAGLSALSGVLVLIASLPLVGVVDAPWILLTGFTLAVAILVHPAVFSAVASRLLRPLGAGRIPSLRYRTTLAVLAYYSLTWPLGGAALFFLIRAVGGDPDPASIPFLGGATAVGAIVAVLTVFAPSGLGVREASVYGLILTVTTPAAALGAIVLNRFAITVVEAALLGVGALAWKASPTPPPEPRGPAPRPEPDAGSA
jgi:glycosyltransferase 2 family protein